MYCNGLGPDGKVYCKHREEAARRKANNPKHPNRENYCCKRLQSDETRCDFWHWADEVPKAEEIPSSSSSAVQSPTRRWQPSKEGNTRVQPTPTRSPQKHFAPSNTPSKTQRSKKRIENIEAGLKQRAQDLSPTRPQTGSSKEPGPSNSSTGEGQIVPQPPSPVPTEVDCEVETKPRTSFLGLYDTPPLVTATLEAEEQPATPKKRRLTPPTEAVTVQQATSEVIPSGGGLPLTPPQTTRRARQSDARELDPATTRNRKGKQREDVPLVRPEEQTEQPQEDDSLPVFTLPEDMSSTSSASPTIAENVLDYVDGVKARVKALSEYMESFDITQAGKLLQIIERQKFQYECRDQSQKQRIEELVAEKNKLTAEVARLKEALQLSEEKAVWKGD